MKNMDDIRGNFSSYEPWGDPQYDIMSNLDELNYKYINELNETPIQVIYLDTFPHIAMLVKIDPDSIDGRVMLLEISSTVRKSLEDTFYTGKVIIEYYDMFAEIIEIDMEKI